MRFIAVAALVLCSFTPATVSAQQEETLADIRQQLSILFVDVQRLKRELSTTLAPRGSENEVSVLSRIDAIELELQRLTGKTEQLEFRIERIVKDGTNRIGDLEFRLVELEGGDVSQLGETTTLGGDVAGTIDQLEDTGSGDGVPTELAIGEEADFQRAYDALDSGDFLAAADQFRAFNETYPGSPLSAEAFLRQGEALEGSGATADAARAYLESYSGHPNNYTAPEALFRLGTALGKLGQTREACVTLNEVGVRHPGDSFVGDAQAEMQRLQCS
ncbi:MAG: tol-pal system protein YbgF [Cognatishimia sp.]|nr:tol-pal system protein YbgF [Cognatishimia sp.]